MICEFYKKDLYALKRIIGNLKSCENQDKCNLDACREFICSECYEECDECMFFDMNHIYGLSCCDTIGLFDKVPLRDIIKRLGFIYSQLYIYELNSCKRFKSGGVKMLYESFYPHDFPLLTSKDLYEILSTFKIRKTPYVICEHFNSCDKCPFFFKNTSITKFKDYKCTNVLCGNLKSEIDDFQITLKAIRRLFRLMNGYKKFK